jgi:ribonuclease BN (tRNA processing enzyme)
LKLKIPGCSDAFGINGRKQSGYFFEASKYVFLVDCGPTSPLTINCPGFDSNRLDAILLSYLHGDHCTGLHFYLLTISIGARKPPG